jgi:hypothetical protein
MDRGRLVGLVVDMLDDSTSYAHGFVSAEIRCGARRR